MIASNSERKQTKRAMSEVVVRIAGLILDVKRGYGDWRADLGYLRTSSTQNITPSGRDNQRMRESSQRNYRFN